MSKIYVQEATIRGKRIYIYLSNDQPLKLEGLSISFGGFQGYFIVVVDKLVVPDSGELVRLPSEQSLLSFYPLNLIYGLDAARAMDVVRQCLQILRAKDSRVLCFYKGCRKPAKYYALPKTGLRDGCWYACSPEHFSEKTTKGYPLNPNDYKKI